MSIFINIIAKISRVHREKEVVDAEKAVVWLERGHYLREK